MHRIIAEDLEYVLQRTLPLWEEIRGKRIFITGGTGFFGKWLLESFAYANRSLKLGAKVVVLTRSPQKFKNSHPHLFEDDSISLHEGDICNFRFPEGSFTHVIHAASELSSPNQADPIGLLTTTFNGVKRICDFTTTSGASKLLFTSSGAVYGNACNEKFSEDGPVAALELSRKGAYGEAKRLAELICTLASHERGFQTKIARGFAFIGPFLSLDLPLAASSFLKNIIEEKSISITGHGQNMRSYLYGADLAVWLWTILIKGETCRPYNLGSDQAISIKTLADTMARINGGSIKVEVLRSIQADEIIESYIPNINRAKKELNLEVGTTFEQAIERTLQFYK